MNKPTLYAVGIEGAEIEALLIEGDGELTPELEARLDAFLSSGKDKLTGAAMVVRGLEASAANCEAEAKRLKERAQSFDNNAKTLKSRMLFAVDAAFDGKVKTDLFTIWGQNSAATVAFDVAPDADLAKIAEANPGIIRTTLSLDKQVLKMKHDAGEELPSEVTVMENPGTRYLRIK
jgi:hypothetical protein